MINYKEEVLKVYPNAECIYESYSAISVYGYEIRNELVLLAEICITESAAWESAYNNLKQQGKL
jgi:hypothetical protein